MRPTHLAPTPVESSETFGAYCTPREAAATKNTSVPAVYDALASGKLTPYAAFGQLVLRAEDVKTWEVRQNKRRTSKP